MARANTGFNDFGVGGELVGAELGAPCFLTGFAEGRFGLKCLRAACLAVLFGWSMWVRLIEAVIVWVNKLFRHNLSHIGRRDASSSGAHA